MKWIATLCAALVLSACGGAETVEAASVVEKTNEQVFLDYVHAHVTNSNFTGDSNWVESGEYICSQLDEMGVSEPSLYMLATAVSLGSEGNVTEDESYGVIGASIAAFCDHHSDALQALL